MQKKIVVAFGELLWDILGDEKLLGGAPANFGYHCRQLDADARIVSAIGNDKDGDEIIARFNLKGLTTGDIQRNPLYPTGTVTVLLDGKGIPTYTIHEDVAWDHIEWKETLQSLAAIADAFCFGSLSQRNGVSRTTLQKMLSSVSPTCLRIFDVNLREPYYSEPLLIQSLESASVLKMNEEEALILGRMNNWGSDLQIIIQKFFERFPVQLIAVTSGEEGSRLFTREQESFMKVNAVTIADTIGAGDSFTAALVIGCLEQLPLEEIHAMATNLSAFICTQRGGMPDYNADLVLH